MSLEVGRLGQMMHVIELYLLFCENFIITFLTEYLGNFLCGSLFSMRFYVALVWKVHGAQWYQFGANSTLNRYFV